MRCVFETVNHTVTFSHFDIPLCFVFAASPLPLQDLCRRCVRVSVGKEHLENVYQLPLPNVIKRYLLFQWTPAMPTNREEKVLASIRPGSSSLCKSLNLNERGWCWPNLTFSTLHFWRTWGVTKKEGERHYRHRTLWQ